VFPTLSMTSDRLRTLTFASLDGSENRAKDEERDEQVSGWVWRIFREARVPLLLAPAQSGQLSPLPRLNPGSK
jgi:hypothetical protein